MSIPAPLFPVRAAIAPLPILDATVTAVEIVPGVAALPPAFSVRFLQADGSVLLIRDSALSQTQWDEWAEGEDDGLYILTCCAANLGFTVR